MNKLKINNENCPISEIALNNGFDFTVRFRKSGRIYRYNSDICRKNIIRQFNDIHMRFNLFDVADLLIDKINKKRKEDQKDLKYPILISNISIKLYENDESVFINKFSNPDSFLNINTDVESLIKNSDGQFNSDMAWMFFNRLSNTIYDQSMNVFNVNDIDALKIKTDNPDFGIMHFYTKHQITAGSEIWYKAVDPLAWFGQMNQK